MRFNDTPAKRYQDHKSYQTTLSHDITAGGSGLFKLVVRAWYNNVMKADSAFYFIRTATVTEPVPAGLKPGVNVTGDNDATFLLYAPGKNSVFVLGDFNDWIYCDEGFMKQSPDGNWFWIAVSGLDPADEYGFQYMIDESIRIPDPYTTKVLDPWNDKYIDAATYPDLKPYPEGKADGLAQSFGPARHSMCGITALSPLRQRMILSFMSFSSAISSLCTILKRSVIHSITLTGLE